MAVERPTWGWGRPERTLLGVMVAAGAVALLARAGVQSASDATPPPPLVVDVNAAPPAVLLALPGLGPSRVGGIVAAREDRPFDSLEDLAMRVKGIGPATIAGIRPFVRVGTSGGAGGDPPGEGRPSTRPPIRPRDGGGSSPHHARLGEPPG